MEKIIKLLSDILSCEPSVVSEKQITWVKVNPYYVSFDCSRWGEHFDVVLSIDEYGADIVVKHDNGGDLMEFDTIFYVDTNKRLYQKLVKFFNELS